MPSDEELFERGWFKEPARDGKEWGHPEARWVRMDRRTAEKWEAMRQREEEAKKHATR